MWHPVVEQLKDRYHCLLPDLPEQGRSQPGEPFTIEGSAASIADLIRCKAHHGRASIVGLSEGAQVGVALLALAPDLVERAVISSALTRPLPGMGMITPGLVAVTFKLFVAPFKGNDGWIRLNMNHAAGVPERFFPQFRQSFREQTENGFIHLMIENARFRLPVGIEKAQAPVLVVVGKKEYMAMKQSARDLSAALPNAHSVVVSWDEKSSLAQEHNWALNRPDLFAQTVSAWLEDKPLPAELSKL